jgi:hypothetical protein
MPDSQELNPHRSSARAEVATSTRREFGIPRFDVTLDGTEPRI